MNIIFGLRRTFFFSQKNTMGLSEKMLIIITQGQ